MISLQPYNTFGIDAYADDLITITTTAELQSLIASKQLMQKPYLILGGGSNMVFMGHYHGTVVRMANEGIRCVGETNGEVIVEAQAGEVWDRFVRVCVANGWHGAENLVAIPGTVGASPVQNVGAYGMEAKDIIHSVKAYEVATGKCRTFTNEECHFAYRSSIFKTTLGGQYVVASVCYHLSREFCPNLSYGALASALEAQGIAQPTAQQLVDTITQIRDSKLPNPKVMGSAGSFFKNPIVDEVCYRRLLDKYPDMVAYPVGKQYKLAAGWLIEHAGWKGRSLGKAGVYEKQALVLVNRGGCTGEEVRQLAKAIVADVEQQFGVSLSCEAILVGDSL